MQFDEYGRPIKGTTATSNTSTISTPKPVKSGGFDEYGRPIKSGSDTRSSKVLDRAVQATPAKHPLDVFEDTVPGVGHAVGAIEGIYKMTAQMIGTGFGEIGNIAGVVDKDFVHDVQTDPLLQPSTDTGLAIQNFIGGLFHSYTEFMKPVTESLGNQIPGFLPAPVHGVIGATLETTAAGIPFLVPYAPKAAHNAIKRSRERKAEAEARAAQEQKMAKDAALRKEQGLPEDYQFVDYKPTVIPDTRPDVAGPSLSFNEFSSIYRGANKGASTREVSEAYMNYRNEAIIEAYKIGKDSNVFRIESEGQAALRIAQDRVKDLEQNLNRNLFVEQGKHRYPDANRNAGTVEYTPLTMTRAEFEQVYLTKTFGAEIKRLEDQITTLKDQAREYAKSNPDPNSPVVRNAARKIESLEKKIRQLENKANSPVSKSTITKLYNKYLKDRIPWEQKPAQSVWKDTFASAFTLREMDAAALKVLQEEAAWVTLEQQLGTHRYNAMQLAMKMAFDKKVEMDALMAKVNEAAYSPARPSTIISNRNRPNNLDQKLKDIKEATESFNEQHKNLPNSDGIIVQEPINMPGNVAAQTREGINRHLGNMFRKDMPLDAFKSAAKEAYPGLPDNLIESMYNTLKKSEGKVAETIEDVSKIDFSTKKRGIVPTIVEAFSGKAISMLFENAKYSPSLKAILQKILRTEIQHLGSGEINATIGVITGYKLQMSRFSSRLQGIYDTLQLNTGKGMFVGPKNIAPEFIGGWAGKSLPKAMNDQLYFAVQGKPLKGTSAAVLEAARQIRKLEEDVFNYLKDSGLQVEYVKNHLARMWDVSKIKKNMEAWENMMRKRGFSERDIEEIFLEITENGGMIEVPVRRGKVYGRVFNQDVRTSRLANNVEKTRKLQNLSPEDVHPFVNTNVHHVMVKYLDQATKRGEFARRFGANQEILDTMLTKAQQELLAQGRSLKVYEVQRLYNIIDAIQNLYKVIQEPWINNLIRWPISIANFAVLQFATIASIPEIVLPMYQGGIRTWARAVPTAVHAVARDFIRENINKGVSKTELQQFNESIAKAGEVFTAERIMNLYASSNWSSLDSFTFSVNLMHAWTKFANYVAVETYRNQVKNTLKRWNNPKHKDTALDAHTERLFNYYGMGRAEALEWYRGGMRKDHPMYERYQNGAVTFAEDTVLTSNPAIRPMWHSIPALAMIAHLKGFPTMFGNTVLKRWYMDTRILFQKKGLPAGSGYPPAYMFVTGMGMYMSGLLAVKIKDQLAYGGEHPKYKNDDFLSLSVRAIETIGGLGMGSTVLDAIKYGAWKGYLSTTLFGPSAEVIEDVIRAAVSAATWDADNMAQAVDKYVTAFILNLPRLGIEVTPTTKKEVRQWLENMFHEYLGMEKNKD